MAVGSTQPLTELSNRNLLGDKVLLARKADNLTAICESLDVSQPYGSPPPVTGIALPYLLVTFLIKKERTIRKKDN
jgi:hypothetical protein